MLEFVALLLASVGQLMGPSGGVGPAPPSFALTTESGTKITTEAGSPLRTETDTP